MRAARGILRFSAVISAVTLLGIYVYDQAGGKLVTLPTVGQPSASDSRMLPGSKSAAVFDETVPSRALPGSKSKVIFAPGTAPPGAVPPSSAPSAFEDEAPQSEPAVVITSAPQRSTLPGSKGTIVFPPTQAAAEQAPASEAPQAAEQRAPHAANEEDPFR